MSHSLSSGLCDDTLQLLICSRSGEFDFNSSRTQEVTFTQNLNKITEGKNTNYRRWTMIGLCGGGYELEISPTQEQ